MEEKEKRFSAIEPSREERERGKKCFILHELKNEKQNSWEEREVDDGDDDDELEWRNGKVSSNGFLFFPEFC